MKEQPALNLPTAPLRTRQEGERMQVFDTLRQLWVALTPEEWVRQHFVHYLIEVKHYPYGRMGNEISLKVGEMKKRCDTVIYGKHGEPIIIVEYKAPHVAISQRVFDQTWRYNLPLHVPYIIISNGLQHYCLYFDYASNSYRFLNHIPTAEELM